MEPEVYTTPTGPLETNTYLVVSGQSCLIIDPSSGCDEVVAHIHSRKLQTAAIVLTHGHFDHMLGLAELQEQLNSPDVYLHPADIPLLSNNELNGASLMGVGFVYNNAILPLTEGTMQIGSFSCTVLHVPGHTPGGCAVLIGKHCFCGDSIFAGSVGRTDLPGGDSRSLIESIKSKLLTLPETTILYPGHGNRSTIGRERRLNPFLQ